MSAIYHEDITLIRDEDQLKKLWQETEDFGKKKEIRSHMYKLREARLKDLYNTSEVKGVSLTTSTKTPFNQSTHADSLADHSFASLKSKEIRDSESPTRDVSYRITGSTNNVGWNISKIDERSEDGKSRRIVQTAQTSGSEIIPKGKLDFEAKCNQAVTSFQDGDDKNFVRSHGQSSNTTVRQEAVGGDENCSFKTSSTKSSSSSKTVTEQKMSYDDSSDYLPHQHKISNNENYIQKSVKVYENDAPQELKNHPGYVEGKTKITRETKTLSDGTVVTTTKYETTGANEMRSTSSNQYSSSNSSSQQSKSNYVSSTSQGEKYSSHKTIVDSEQLPIDQPQSRSRYYVEKTHTIPDNSSDSYQTNISNKKTIVDHKTYKKEDQSISDRISNEKYGIVITSDSRNDQTSRLHTDDQRRSDERRTQRQEQYQGNSSSRNTNTSHHTEDVRKERTSTDNKQHNTTVYQDVNSVPLGTPIEIEIDVSKMDINDTRNVVETSSSKQNTKIVSKSPDRIDRETKRQPIKPTESEWKTDTKATKDQYDTTYRKDYTNKRISVELSPTHEAFARSLRAVSPDRLSSRSSSRNLKNSNSSLRSSSSPEKTYVNHGQPRSSPDSQRCYSPSKKTPDRLSSTETITYSSRPSVERTSPHTSQKTKHITETRITSSHADVLNKKTKSLNDDKSSSTTYSTSTFTRISPTKSPVRASTPNRSERHRTTVDITTDLDDNVSTNSYSTISKTEQIRPSTLQYQVTETVEVTNQSAYSPSNPISNSEKSPKSIEKKDKPVDRPLKRSDTYEERCRQILGITNEKTERRRSSLEKLKRRGSTNSTTIEVSSKDTSIQQHKVVPGNRTSPSRFTPQTKDKTEKQVTPKKQKSPLQEFPAQIRRSPEKSPKQPSPTTNPNEKSPETYLCRELPPQRGSSPNEKTKMKDRRSPSSELNKNSKQRSPDKEVIRDVQRSPSVTKTTSENHKIDKQTKTYDDIKNKHNLKTTKHDNTVSVKKELTQVAHTENQSESLTNDELYSSPKLPRDKVRNEEVKNNEYLHEKTSITESNANLDNTSQTAIHIETSRRTKQTDDSNIMFIKQEVLNQSGNENDQPDSYDRRIQETQDTIKYNETTEKKSRPNSATPQTSTIRKTSPVNKKPIGPTETGDINTKFIEQEVTNRKISEEDQLNTLDQNNSNVQEHINQDTCTITSNQNDYRYGKPTEVTASQEPTKTSSPRATTPLKEYPSQIRKSSDIDDVNKKFIKEEISNRQVISEAPKKHITSKPHTSPTGRMPNISQKVFSTQIEDVCNKTSVDEAPKATASNKIVISEINQYAVSEDDHSKTQLEKLTRKSYNQNSDFMSVASTTEVTIDDNTSNSITKTPLLKDNFKPDTSNIMHLENEFTEQDIATDGDSFVPQKDNKKEINTKDLKDSPNILEKTPQHKQAPTSRKHSQPKESVLPTTHRSRDTFDDASEVVDDIIYTNGDICEKNIVDENIHSITVLQSDSRDILIDSQNEIEITSQKTTTKNKRIDNLPKQKDSRNKEQDISRSREPKPNVLQAKEKPSKRITEDKSSIVKKTTISKDSIMHKDKPVQKVTNYPAKKSTPTRIIRTDISKYIQDENDIVNTKKHQRSNVKLDNKSNRQINEIHKKQNLKESYEGRTPVEEPLVIKKTVSLLYSDDEDDKKNCQMLIESEIVDKKPIIEKKKEKSERPSKTNSTKFIANEKKESLISKQSLSKSSPKSITSVQKKPLTEKNQSKPKISNETEYTDKYRNKLPQLKYDKNKRQNTLTDIENFDDLKTDNKPHARFHRIDDSSNKTKSTNLKIEKDEGLIKISKKITPLKKPSSEVPNSKGYPGKTNQNVKPKSVEPEQQSSKQTKPSSKVKHVVSTTILLKPKNTTSTVETVTTSKKTLCPKKKIVESEESDDESITDSLDEKIHTSVNEKIVKTVTSKSTLDRSSPERKSPSKDFSQPISIEEKPKVTKPKLEKRCISTKSIIINNADRGVTVDLQRSISSREPTPDRVCPLPVTSDDDGISPRLPDKVVEPDDTTLKRNSHRLFETVIQENDDVKNFQRIVEITDDIKQKVTDVDKVDNDDDSLLTVNKKINKFLITADKLTEKPIMDISQPAPKVERQKFEITEDLKEDDCLLSVSDKVNKFINEAEHLTSHNNFQSRKSVNIDNRNDIINKITLTPELKLNQEIPAKPTDEKYVPKNTSLLRKNSKQLFDENRSTIQQDVFITTECDQIEKEQDLYRSRKHSSEITRPKEESVYSTTSETFEPTISKPKPYSRRSKSPDKASSHTPSEEPRVQTKILRETENDIDYFTKGKQQIVETPKNRKTPAHEPSKEFTPKNRRPSQEEKVILSTVGRLRSNESIKKAKALFENKSSDKEIQKYTETLNHRSVVGENKGNNKQMTRRPIDRSSLTPKKLDFPTDDDRSVRPSTNKTSGTTHLVSKQQTVGESKVTTTIRKSDIERDVARDIKHLKQQSPQREFIKSKDTTDTRETERNRSRERELPGYMKPLDRNTRPHSPEDKIANVTETIRTQVIDTCDDREEIPGYMKPLDRTLTHRSPQREDKYSKVTSEKHTYEDNKEEIPGYMKPIKTHSHKDHHHASKTDKEEVSSYETTATHDSKMPSIHHKKKYSNTSQNHQKHSHTDSNSTEHLPGYMKQFKPHTHHNEYSQISESHHTHHHREADSTDELPGYMKPLTKHNHQVEELHVFTTHDSDKPRGSIQTDEIPGYMKPILSHRHNHKQTDFTDVDENSDSKILEERLSREQSPHKDCSTTFHEVIESAEESCIEDVPGYMKPLDRSNRPHSPKRESHSVHMKPTDRANRPHSPQRDTSYGYMKPLDRSVSPHSPSGKRPNEPHGTTTKFGVTLKKTDSIKGITSTSKVHKKHPILSKKNITEEEIEEIFELEVLEELLLIVTGYELRRHIRTQIRTVKKLIAEDKLEVTIRNIRNKNSEENQSKETNRTEVKYTENDNKTTKQTSHVRDKIELKRNDESFENTSVYTRKESTSSLVRSETPSSRSSKSPERRSPERKTSSRVYSEESSTKKTVDVNRHSTQKINNVNTPLEQTTKTTNIFKSNLKKTENITKGPVNNTQPEWTTQRNLKKVDSSDTLKKTATAKTKTVKKETVRSSSPSKEMKPTDVITSSYGVGPTDENGTPLFGLKALRAQNKSVNTKVQGTVVSSQYYSETGKEPIGQISVTKYSSDPKDLGSNENLTHQDEGILSITTTQKFGFDGAPSLQQLSNNGEDIRGSKTDRKSSTSKSSTVIRRNSVKALTQKFVENAVETSKSEQQSSYPKAGLILRSSSFKNDSAIDASDRYSEVTAEERTQKSMSVISSNSRVVSGGTFLRNKSKVTGIQDVVTRMKAEEVEAGDTSEDVEARGLLNKYLGSQAILSGLEGQISKTTTATARTASSSTAVRNTTTVTTVIVENGKEVKKTRVFEHPISNEVLETVWDEQTLRYLLEQSTDYEERKSIRARLRVIMAEQEACTELVKQASQDQSGQSVDETTETNREVVTEGPVTTTKVTTSRVITQQTTSKKPISPFAKFRQLDKQNSLNTPLSTPRTPGGSPLFKFTDAALSQSASTIKDRLLYWCRMKTKEYENIQLDNFSSSWADGLAFCALIHHFLPNSFDYHVLTPKERRHNFTLAFKVADEKADIAPLLDVDDMVATRKPDWKCVFTYVQSIYRRFKDED